MFKNTQRESEKGQFQCNREVRWPEMWPLWPSRPKFRSDLWLEAAYSGSAHIMEMCSEVSWKLKDRQAGGWAPLGTWTGSPHLSSLTLPSLPTDGLTGMSSGVSKSRPLGSDTVFQQENFYVVSASVFPFANKIVMGENSIMHAKC